MHRAFTLPHGTRSRLGLYAPDDFFVCCLATLKHLDKGQAALAQTHGGRGGRTLAVLEGLNGLFGTDLFFQSDRLQ